MFAKNEQMLLLQYAKAILVEKLEGHMLSEELEAKIQEVPLFQEERGVFVSLHIGGELRGCIGYIEPIKPLIEAVAENSINAGFRDPRFSSLSLKELETVEIEISVLTVPKPIPSYKEFEVGKHGIILKKDHRQAVFLPQVAPEQGWDRDTTLMYLSHKAGLSPDAWKDECEFLVFEAEHFSDSIASPSGK